jgi:diaminopimelate epimerase
MQLKFTKMHGLGNDFVVLEGTVPPAPELIQQLSDRRTGVGFDQLLWVEPAHDAVTDGFYRTFNADGSEAEQCGNGARCIARFVAAGRPEKSVLKLGFSGGVVEARLESDGNIAVALGEPNFDPVSLPFAAENAVGQIGERWQLDADGNLVDVELVSMGNPHAVIAVESVAAAPVTALGSVLERHVAFPNRANIGFMQIESPERIRLRVFERGVGETRACGTGACAAVAVGHRAGKLADDVNVELPGGVLKVRWSGTGSSMWLVGEAVTAFQGIVAI